MLTNPAWRRRKIVRDLAANIEGADRFVDIGTTIHIVERDPNGSQLIKGKPPLRVVDSKTFGGVVDCRAAQPRIRDDMPTRHPCTWYCSVDQWPIVQHADDAPLGQLVYGSEGSGKTTALVIWMYLRWLEILGERREIGLTAPTETRINIAFREFAGMFLPNWYRYQSSTGVITLCEGTRIRLVSTYRQSKAQGSPIQGFNWSAAARDEGQDQIDVHEDIESRGRAAKDGRYKQIITATAKDDADWRTMRDGLKSARLPSGEPQWRVATLLGLRSPFIAPSFWDAKKQSMSDREYRRRILAEDLPPETRIYSAWSRDHNLRPVPLIGARHVTSYVLRAKTGNANHKLLIGHDPGAAKAASIFLDAYDLPGDGICWWVRGELFTLHKTSEQHALEALAIARRFGCNSGGSEIAHVRALPIGQAQDKADQDVYRIWSRVGLEIKAAQHKVDGTGTGHIPREARIEMVQRLLCDAAGRRRLFIDCDELRRPKAPRLVEAFETLERDERGQIGKDKRLDYDKSDPADALGYALWPFEKEAAAGVRAGAKRAVELTRG